MIVSIVIPTYNRPEYLKKAVEAALNQTYPSVEIIISQNPRAEGLESATKQWAEQMAATHPQIKYYFNQTNLGIAGNYNASVDRISGEFAMIIGDDDVLLPNCIEDLVKYADKDTDLVFGNRYFIDSKGNPMDSTEHQQKFDEALVPGVVNDIENIVWRNLVPLTGSIIRTKWLRELRFLPDNTVPDLEFFARLAANKTRFYFTDSFVATSRVHGESLTVLGQGTYHLLSECLIPIPVSSENKKVKQDLIATMIVPAVNQSLQTKNKQLARMLLHSGFYPKTGKKYGLWMMQNLLTSSPQMLTDAAFGLLSIYKKMRRAPQAPQSPSF